MSTSIEDRPPTATDPEERQRLEDQIERFACLADLAHKINNPLTSVMGRAQLLRLKQDGDPAVKKAVGVIDEATQRIAAYVRELAQIVRVGKASAEERLGIQPGTTRDIR